MVNNSKNRIIFQAIDKLGHPESFTTGQLQDQLLNKNFKYIPSSRELSQILKSNPLIKKIGETDRGYALWSLK